MKKFFIFSFVCFVFIYNNLLSQDVSNEIEPFEFDAIVFKSDSLNKSRLDVYALIPYQTLNFSNSSGHYSAKYSLNISIYDTSDNIVASKVFERNLLENEYFVTVGGTAKFDALQNKFNLLPGKYRIEARLNDYYSNKSYEKKREVTALNFDGYDFAISGIMLLSMIEENNGKYKITPYISDNISVLKDGWFAFFETYNKSRAKQIDLIYQIVDEKNNVFAGNNRIRMTIDSGRKQQFIQIPYKPSLKEGNYQLRIFALTPSNLQDFAQKDLLALVERSISFKSTLGTYVVDNIDDAVKQLEYVAENSEIKFIKSGKNEEEKRERFFAFWNKLDPTPGTDINEAFEQYYMRINFANKTFQGSYLGWQTPKGMVYVIYGPPIRTEQYNSMSMDNRNYERWVYSNGIEVIFYDANGFGDFRLYRPPVIFEKYKYKN